MTAPSKPRPSRAVTLLIDDAEDRDWLENYDFWVSTGRSREEIVKLSNMSRSGVEKRLERLGRSASVVKFNRRDRQNKLILDRMIATGQRFTSESLPLGSTEEANGVLIERARKAGLIRRDGTMEYAPGKRLNAWIAVEK